MGKHHFSFRQFTIQQDQCSMKVCTDACLFGAWVAAQISSPDGAPATVPVGNILDIGSGTGLLSLMLAQKSTAHIECIEIDENACKQSIENVERSPWSNRIKVVCGDVNQVPMAGKNHLVISNPPFYEHSLQSPVSKNNLARHEAGLTFEALVEIASANLLPSGIFAVLVPYHRSDFLLAAARKSDLHPMRVVNVRQTPRHAYFRSMLLFAKSQSGVPTQTEMFIKDDAGYSAEFVALLKDYYLYLSEPE